MDGGREEEGGGRREEGGRITSMVRKHFSSGMRREGGGLECKSKWN